MFKNYLKIAYKVFLRRKFFTFISLFAISFTLLVLMVATAFYDHTFGPFAPETKHDRMLGLMDVQMKGPNSTRNGPAGYGLLDRVARNLPNVEQVSFFTTPNNVYSYKDGKKIKSQLKRTDGAYWQILDFNFLEGGPFTFEDDKNANFVAVINEATRRKFFDNASAIGKTIDADGQHFRIVGVVANVPTFRFYSAADIWVPITTAKTDSYRKELMGSFQALFLAGSPRDFDGIKAEFKMRMSQIEMTDPNYKTIKGEPATTFEHFSRILGTDYTETHSERLTALLLTLMIAFMLLPTINLININISRIMERASEIGVRKAFGASSWTLVGQFVVENVLLSLIGGLIAFVLSWFVLRGITESGVIPYAVFHLNYRIFFYSLIIAIFFGLFSGVYPAWKMSRLNPVAALKGGMR